jgi:hypothetical protein
MRNASEFDKGIAGALFDRFAKAFKTFDAVNVAEYSQFQALPFATTALPSHSQLTKMFCATTKPHSMVITAMVVVRVGGWTSK